MGCGINAGNQPCSNSSKPSDTIPISTVEDRCGPEYGKCADKNACCSEYGWCDTTSTHCGTGCQPEYGLCDNSNVVVSIPVSQVKDRFNGRCGPDYGRCANSNECCSQYGWCDTTSAHCGTGCQPKYGLCGSSNVKSIPVSKVSGRCGPEYGRCANSNECCSQYGWCDTKSEHCGTGCQPKYDGKYKSCGITAGYTSCTGPNIPYTVYEDRCGPKYGKCTRSNECCSQYGWCDTSKDHCGIGCQPLFGICKSSISVSPVNDRCGPRYGRCAKSDECCSEYGWCDKTIEHCGTGCQPLYGICK
ncbi:carbohydrate-binding module family 18 protein [Piromyces sp. E2]|nr:carbohydrate-binding module family 18 protein [Piromyces sp. E2]|eukprot:OUM64772.1 carbohydrate-binding module family 18 protein [Piromyces sp. E2]